jgi:hypothetical protein
MRRQLSRTVRVLSLVLVAALGACDGGGLPPRWRATPLGTGPRVVWDLTARPLPEIPLPNDMATWPDPSSPTGRRINASLVAPTGIESRLRARFDALDGWGTFAPITVSFDAPLDTDDLIARQGGSRFSEGDFQRHAIYLVDLETGVPVPLDVNSGRFQLSVADPGGYYGNDPRGGESNVLFETVEEDRDGDGLLDPLEDTDGDGVLDHPNTLDGLLLGTPYETYDRTSWFYERETDTLVLRPILPLEQMHTYAVVLTDRLRGAGGTVASPFDAVHHPAQYEELRRLPELFAAHPEIYGELASEGWDGVAFAWSFTTQSTTADLDALREGLYGRGPFARLATEFPARLVPAPVRGGRRCELPDNLFTVTPGDLREALASLPLDGLGVPAEQLGAVLDALESSVSHFAIGFFESPYLLGDPDAEGADDTWQLDRRTGEARVARDLVPMFIVVPKETATHRQPFPVAFYAHGYGSVNLEAIAFAGLTAQHGIATVSIDAQGHGLPLAEGLRRLIEPLLATYCLAPLGDALSRDRARDLNGDGAADSAGLFFSAYMFHTRDALRQSTLDILQAIRIVRSFQGAPGMPADRPWEAADLTLRDGEVLSFSGDLDGDGAPELAGDFDGDGTPDLGGWDRPNLQWGSSLGGILSMLVTGVEPSIVAAAPVSGGGGLFDLGLRTELGTARHPIWLRVMGPILASQASDGPTEETACAAGEISLRFELPDLSERVRVELACVAADELEEGDAVVVQNLVNREKRCAPVTAGGRFRAQVPSDAGDLLEIRVFEGGAASLGARTCTFRVAEGAPQPSPRRIVSTWESGNGTSGAGVCARCARYQGRVFGVGEPLVSPIEGLGLRRQSPELRRLSTLAQIAVDPADPVNYARRVFLDPPRAEDVTPRTRSVLVTATVGDTTVPVSAAHTYARAAGVIAFMPADAPEVFADHRAPARFAARWGMASPDDLLIARHVPEGLARLERYPVGPTTRFLFDVDDFSEGQQYFSADGDRQIPESEGGVRPEREAIPLRWARESRLAAMAGGDPWDGASTFEGHSALVNAMTLPEGQHVVLPVDPRKAWDDGAYFVNLIGWYLASEGRDLPYLSRPDEHQCLERNECPYPD